MYCDNLSSKVFKDIIHGYIEVPEVFVRDFIDTDVFQRLRNIEQTGMRVLFPSARHDRFSHSLGCFHIGKKGFRALKNNIRKYHIKYFSIIEANDKQKWDELEVLFLLSCLLHDCGHSPYSHAYEYLLDAQSMNNKIKDIYTSNIEFIHDFATNSKPKPHEIQSAIFVNTFFKDIIINLFNEEFQDLHFEPNDDLEFIARAIMGCTYSDADHVKQVKNCMIKLLNSESIDIDKLDYLTRDTVLSGVDNVSIDIDRLINAVTIVETFNYEDADMNIDNFDAVILNGKLLNGEISGNAAGIIDIPAEEGQSFKGSIKNLLSLSGYGEILSATNCTGLSSIGGIRYINNIPSPEGIVPFTIKTVESENLHLCNASFLTNEDSNMEIQMEKPSCIYFTSAFLKGSLRGRFSGKILGIISDEGLSKTTQIELAFHKSSLSVLHNVIHARNYEYFWVYAHHKVVYYSNYLLLDLLYKTAEYLATVVSESKDAVIKKILSMYEINKLNNHSFYMSNDSDIIALFKSIYIEIKTISSAELSNEALFQLEQLFKELFLRKFKKSVWKSYAEFNMYFSDLPDEQRKNLKTKLADISVSNVGDTISYGYFKDRWKEKFKEFGMSDVIWVSALIDFRSLCLDKTFILMKNKPIRLRDVTVGNDNQSSLIVDSMFYLYYKPIKDEVIKLDEMLLFLKEEARSAISHMIDPPEEGLRISIIAE